MQRDDLLERSTARAKATRSGNSLRLEVQWTSNASFVSERAIRASAFCVIVGKHSRFIARARPLINYRYESIVNFYLHSCVIYIIIKHKSKFFFNKLLLFVRRFEQVGM